MTVAVTYLSMCMENQHRFPRFAAARVGQVVESEYGDALEMARAHGWTGVCRDGPHVFTVPNDATMQLA